MKLRMSDLEVEEEEVVSENEPARLPCDIDFTSLLQSALNLNVTSDKVWELSIKEGERNE